MRCCCRCCCCTVVVVVAGVNCKPCSKACLVGCCNSAYLIGNVVSSRFSSRCSCCCRCNAPDAIDFSISFATPTPACGRAAAAPTASAPLLPPAPPLGSSVEVALYVERLINSSAALVLPKLDISLLVCCIVVLSASKVCGKFVVLV